MPDLDQEAAALQLETRAALRDLVRNGSDAESAAAERVLQARLAEDLRTFVGNFQAGSARFAELANGLQDVVDAIRVNPVGDALAEFNGLLDRSIRLGRAIRNPETLPSLADDGLSITFTLPTESDEEETPPNAVAAGVDGDGADLLPPSKSRKFGELKTEYAGLFEHAAIRPDIEAAANQQAGRLVGNSDRYRAVGEPSGIPWYFIACIHLMESSGNFATHLHNGDPLSARTLRVPAGRPEAGEPPFSWEESARDAMALKKFDQMEDWSLPRLLFRWERYNGFGYRPREVPTPYLWSGTTVYTKGKYVADGRFDPDAVSRQIGCATLLKALIAGGAVAL